MAGDAEELREIVTQHHMMALIQVGDNGESYALIMPYAGLVSIHGLCGVGFGVFPWHACRK